MKIDRVQKFLYDCLSFMGVMACGWGLAIVYVFLDELTYLWKGTPIVCAAWLTGGIIFVRICRIRSKVNKLIGYGLLSIGIFTGSLLSIVFSFFGPASTHVRLYEKYSHPRELPSVGEGVVYVERGISGRKTRGFLAGTPISFAWDGKLSTTAGRFWAKGTAVWEIAQEEVQHFERGKHEKLLKVCKADRPILQHHFDEPEDNSVHIRWKTRIPQGISEQGSIKHYVTATIEHITGGTHTCDTVRYPGGVIVSHICGPFELKRSHVSATLEVPVIEGSLWIEHAIIHHAYLLANIMGVGLSMAVLGVGLLVFKHSGKWKKKRSRA